MCVLYLTVVFGDLDGEELLAADVGREAGERLPPRTSDADEHEVAPLQAQHSMDPRHVTHSVLPDVVWYCVDPVGLERLVGVRTFIHDWRIQYIYTYVYFTRANFAMVVR